MGFTTVTQSSVAFDRATRLSSSKSHAEVRNQRFVIEAAVATLWRALARCQETLRGWPRRRPCEVGTSTRTIDKVNEQSQRGTAQTLRFPGVFNSNGLNLRVPPRTFARCQNGEAVDVAITVRERDSRSGCIASRMSAGHRPSGHCAASR